jgi:hypothetical protein
MTSANTTTRDNTQNQSTGDHAEIDELITLPFLLLFVVMLLLLLCVVSSASFTPALMLQAVVIMAAATKAAVLPLFNRACLISRQSNLSAGQKVACLTVFSLLLRSVEAADCSIPGWFDSVSGAVGIPKTSAEGIITDGAGDYPSSQECYLAITVDGAASLTVSFSAFHTESYDKLWIYDGNTTSSTPLLNEFSGASLPPAVTSSSDSVLLKFTSDGGTQKAGLTGTWTSPCAAGSYGVDGLAPCTACASGLVSLEGSSSCNTSCLQQWGKLHC